MHLQKLFRSSRKNGGNTSRVSPPRLYVSGFKV